MAKPSLVEFFRSLSGLLMGEELNGLKKQGLIFPKRYLVTDNWILLEATDDGLVKTCKKEDICGVVSKFLDTNIRDESYKWTAKNIRDFVDHWILLCPQIPLPKAWAFASDKSLTFHRLPWDLDEDGPTPVWDELLGRMTNAAAFKLWVGSLFDDKSDRQTYVWLYGTGQNGKGAILRFLKRVFGSAYASEVVPGRSDRFWTYGLLGKRLVAFPDTNDVGFPATGLFKSLTGDDAIRMEIKGGATFSSELAAKFLYASNDRPELSSECADMRRAILCSLASIVGEADPGYGELLWAEGGAFLGACCRDFKSSGGGIVSGDPADLAAWVSGLEDHYDAILHENFALHVDHIYDKDTPKKNLPRIEAKIMSLVVHKCFTKRSDVRGFYNFIERKYGIKRTTIKLGNNQVENCYILISCRDHYDIHPKRHLIPVPPVSDS